MSRGGGDRWVFEQLVGALPGFGPRSRAAVAVQVVLFEAAVLALGWHYELPEAALAGTVAVLLAGIGSLVLLRLGAGNRRIDAPARHTALLFASSAEVVLAVLGFVALVVHLFVVDPADGTSLVTRLFGPSPPAAAVFLALLVIWDLCYRAATSWWVALVSLRRARRVALDPASRTRSRRLDAVNAGFALAHLVLAPFLFEAPILSAALAVHVVGVVALSAAAAALTGR
ncbi:DUF7530 family protein [Haloparvum sedimenti]|uniref:DUF7530 family protein n=1 Tax=Haloparvum sedimenti TaxID=1678448 RepID=UPI00071E775A|nr:hypothetical protein [Haloparvum sedimenti]